MNEYMDTRGVSIVLPLRLYCKHLIKLVEKPLLMNMLYKLYIYRENPAKKVPDTEMERVFKGFQEIYKQYGVKITGAWINKDDPLEGYLITAYKDQAHYEDAVAKMQTNKTYQKLSQEIQGSREETRVITLTPSPGSPTK